ncbi:thymidine phosphorylase [Phaeobacter porticola]|uniref:Thymidine phosphorylase n=1 Tax=Phaeobacter porticola TaxID=1844006 RepID=A0A1L3I3D7_9RHOB|nr:thymidine phosphorylase [Phaeobacter porticola]APG46616.1 thymidine phosphorylase DeoA [Phaeobacter porticola]
MDARAIIASLRRGETPSDSDLRWFAEGLANGTVSDAQAGAFAMAVCLRGLGVDARRALTLAMRDSGDVLTWNLGGPVLDKHSTGGVGDCVSLLLAPALAECGAYVPMISGRGLGHTGGTLDKMEAIPGVSTQVSEQQLVQMMQNVGCAIVGATAQIAPADKRLYAIRDVTATVDSLDLITASILSKKLAASTDALVLDVKIGSGAFMKTLDEAEALARSLTDTANAAGCKTSALITDMNQPLAPALGNALEVTEVMRVLTGLSGQDGALAELTAAQGGVLLAHGGLAADAAAGAAMIRKAIASGAVADRFARMVAEMGGPTDFSDCWQDILPMAPVLRAITAEQPGAVSAINGEALGMAVVRLGGGRMIESDVVDPSVGLANLAPLGAELAKGELIGTIHAADEAAADVAERCLRAAYQLSEAAPELPPLIHKRIA